MVDFTTPLGLRSDGQFWNINVVNESTSSSFGNLTFNANALTGGNTVLEINDETGNIGVNSSPNNPIIKFSVSSPVDEPSGIAIASSANNIGIFSSANNIAGVFIGDVQINGELIFSSSVVSLDNPLDPANKFLNHANVGSSEMLNVYSGNVVLDSNGEAWVELAEWVEALNSDFRYQLTCIGGTSSVYIAEEVSDNRFKIAGGVSGMKISWQLTGVRKDPWAQEHPLIVDKEKSPNEKGYYYHSELYEQPEEKSIYFAQYPEVMRQMKKGEEL